MRAIWKWTNISTSDHSIGKDGEYMGNNILILTCSRRGTASRCLPSLVAAGASVCGVVYAKSAGGNRRKALWRTFKKILKIGVFGALNGRRMRKWYSAPTDDIADVCAKFNLPYFEVEGLNTDETVSLFKRLSPDLGVSLGNGFISPRVFEIPRLGMINLHTEVLPAYQNASSIIWPIFCNDPYTGYTIHEIVRKIDAGRILLQRRYPIEFCQTLEGTVRRNKAITDSKYPTDVAYVVAHIEELKETAQTQAGGGHYTTPSFFQFLKMVLNNRRFFRKSLLVL